MRVPQQSQVVTSSQAGVKQSKQPEQHKVTLNKTGNKYFSTESKNIWIAHHVRGEAEILGPKHNAGVVTSVVFLAVRDSQRQHQHWPSSGVGRKNSLNAILPAWVDEGGWGWGGAAGGEGLPLLQHLPAA